MNEQQVKIITQLGQLLLNHGDKILSGQTTLLLTSTTLNCLNESFHHIVDGDLDRSFDVQQTSHYKQPVYRDLQYLYDFIQKTIGLKLVHRNITLQGNVNISKFRCVEKLEIKKIPVHMIIGLELVRHKIKSLTVSHSLTNMKDLFSACGGDRAEAFNWPQLRVVNLSYNNIVQLDDSLKLLTNVEALDLSHNCLRTLEHIQYLTELEYLNVGYNSLTSIPLLNYQTQFRLRFLNLRNNDLESLNGLTSLIHLKELDIAYNCLVDHKSLQCLKDLKHLTTLFLEGNPLSFHKNHRQFTLVQLHPTILQSKFQLDGVNISLTEVDAVKRNVCESNEIARIKCTPATRSDAANANITVISNPADGLPPVFRGAGRMKFNGSVSNSSKIDEGIDDLTASFSSNGSTKKKIPRPCEVLIVNSSEDFDNIEPSTCTDEKSTSSTSHLNTKMKVENFRKQLGSGWLVANNRLSTSSSKFMGGAPLPCPTNVAVNNEISPVLLDSDRKIHQDCESSTVISSSVEATSKFDSDALHDHVINTDRPRPETTTEVDVVLHNPSVSSIGNFESFDPISRTTSIIMSSSNKVHRVQSVGSSSTSSNESREIPVTANSHIPINTVSQQGSSLPKNLASPWNFNNEDFSGNRNQPFIVKVERNNTMVTLLVEVDGQYLQEINSLTGCQEDCLDLEILKSIDKNPDKKGMQPEVHLNFDYPRKDRKERKYILEDDESYHAFLAKVEPVFENKLMEDMLRGAMQCLKCHSKFSKEAANLKVKKSKNPQQKGVNLTLYKDKDYLHEVMVCPNCKSELVMESDEPALPKGTANKSKSSAMPATDFAERSSLSSQPRSESPVENRLMGKERSSSDSKNVHLPNKSCANNNNSSSSQCMDTKNVSLNTIKMGWQQQQGKMERFVRDELFSSPASFWKQSKPSITYTRSTPISSPNFSDCNDNSIENSDSRFDEVDGRDANEHLSWEKSLEEKQIVFKSSVIGPSRTTIDGKSTSPVGERLSDFLADESDLASDIEPVKMSTPANFHGFRGFQMFEGTFGEISDPSSCQSDSMLLRMHNTDDELPHSRGLKPFGHMIRSESDITILSNPSMSSIRVISNPSVDKLGFSSGRGVAAESNSRRISAPAYFVAADRTLDLPPSPILERCSSIDGSEMHSVTDAHAETVSSPAQPKNLDSCSSGSISSSVCTARERSDGCSSITAEFTSPTVGLLQREETLCGDSVQSLDTQGSLYFSIDSTSTTKADNSIAEKPYLGILKLESYNQAMSLATPNMGKGSSKSESSVSKSTANAANGNVQYCYEDFTQVDHRVRLYLDMNIFDNEEEFDSILRVSIVAYGKPNEFQGMLVVSSKRIIILKITGPEGSEPQKWLQKVDVRSLSQLRYLATYLGNQAFRLEFATQGNSSMSYLFLLRDADRCNCFVAHFTGVMKHLAFPDLVKPMETYSIAEELLSNLLDVIRKNVDASSQSDMNNDPEIKLYLMGFWNSNEADKPVSIVLTTTHLYLLTENYQWLPPKMSSPSSRIMSTPNRPFMIFMSQLISDIIGMQKTDASSSEGKLMFWSEKAEEESWWHISTETETSFHTLVNGIKGLWDKEFDLELPIDIVDEL